MRWFVTLGLVLVATYATAATVYINGTAINADRVDITSGGGPTPPMPTPGPVPTPGPTTAPGKCPAGTIPLDKPMSFSANTWGLDNVQVPVAVTLHFCAALTKAVSVLQVRTADRTGPSQCSNVRLTLTSPPSSGLPQLTSQAINNTLNRYGTALSGNVVPPGSYLIDVYGDQPRPPCTQQAVMVYWKYPSFAGSRHGKHGKH